MTKQKAFGQKLWAVFLVFVALPLGVMILCACPPSVVLGLAVWGFFQNGKR